MWLWPSNSPLAAEKANLQCGYPATWWTMKPSGCIAGDRRAILPFPSFIFFPRPLESRTHAAVDPQPSRSYLKASSLRSFLLLLFLHRRPLNLPPETRAVFLALKVNKQKRASGGGGRGARGTLDLLRCGRSRSSRTTNIVGTATPQKQEGNNEVISWSLSLPDSSPPHQQHLSHCFYSWFGRLKAGGHEAHYRNGIRL